MAGWEPAQIPLEKIEINNRPMALVSTSSFRNTSSQDPEIQGHCLENSSGSSAYTSPYLSTGQIRSSVNGCDSFPIIHGLHEPVLFPLSVLESGYAYALDRGNGQYTRLVPADSLPTMEGLPKTQGPDGLIILPTPRPGARFCAVTDRHFIQGPSVIGEGRPTSKPAQSADLVQKKIDTIVAALPEHEAVALQVRKAKVYCDKWLHDGTCAFTQQGCRYKHEMPMDKETQIQVGLFNGLPNWYRRQQAMELKSQSSSPSDDSGNFSRGSNANVSSNAAGRRRARYSNMLRTTSAHVSGSSSNLPSSGRLLPRSPFAAISSRASNHGVLSRPAHGVSVSTNPYDVLDESDDVE